MSIAIFLAPGFEEMEAVTIIDILRRAEADVQVVGVGDTLITGSHGITIKSEFSEKNFNFSDNIEAIIFPGGLNGVSNLQKSKFIDNVINKALEKKVYIATICAAPTILGKLGLLYGRQVTCYPGLEDELLGARVVDEDVCVDGKLITSKGPGTSAKFALKIIEILESKKKSQNVQKQLLIY